MVNYPRLIPLGMPGSDQNTLPRPQALDLSHVSANVPTIVPSGRLAAISALIQVSEMSDDNDTLVDSSTWTTGQRRQVKFPSEKKREPTKRRTRNVYMNQKGVRFSVKKHNIKNANNVLGPRRFMPFRPGCNDDWGERQPTLRGSISWPPHLRELAEENERLQRDNNAIELYLTRARAFVLGAFNLAVVS